MCLENLSPIASRTSTSDLPTRPFAAANPARSGTVSRSQTMRLGFTKAKYPHAYALANLSHRGHCPHGTQTCHSAPTSETLDSPSLARGVVAPTSDPLSP